MDKVFLYTGPRKEFDSFVNENKLEGNNKTLSTLVHEVDDAKRRHVHLTVEQAEALKDEEKPVIDNLVVYSNEYSSVNEHVIFNIEGFLSNVKVGTVFFQNPPKILYDKLMNTYDNVCHEKFKYQNLSKDILVLIRERFDSVIIDQVKVKNKILKALVPQVYGEKNKPIVIMFFGPSGVGKTESAKFIADKLGGKILRKQLSMYQSNEFMSYLFGGTIHDKCFAKDLLDRETNVILLDEFDKANTVFYSAFYQLFDEGLFVDNNYSVEVGNPIIICTSNYTNLDEIKKHLGDPIFSRFDSFIEFEKFSKDGVIKLVSTIINKEYDKLNEEAKKYVNTNDIISVFENYPKPIQNARTIQSFIRELIAEQILEKDF